MTRAATAAVLALLASLTLTGCGGPGSGYQPAIDACIERDTESLAEEGDTDEDRADDADLVQGLYDSTFTISEDTLTIDTKSAMTTQMVGGFVACTLEELGAPSSVFHRMLATRALDGTVEETWDNYVATWTYHPDSGLQAVVSQE